MRVGTLYAVLRLNTGAFDAALMNSSSRWTKFTAALRAGTFIAAEAFGAVVVGSILAAQSFQQHMTQSLAIMGDVSDGIRTKMEEAARAVAKTTLFSATEAADAFYFLASAGYTAEQSIAALPQVAAFAQAGLLNLEDATQTLAAIQVTLGMRTGDVGQDMLNMARISDVLTQAAKVSLGTIEGYSEALSRQAGPALRSVNKSVEEGVAVLSVFADQNIIGARAGTALAIVLRDLQSKAIKEGPAFAKFGVAVFDASGNMRNMADIVGDLEGALVGLSDKQKKATLMEMGFTDKSVGFIMALLGQSEAIRTYQKDLEAAGGATQEVAAKQLESFSSQLTIMWHKITDVGIAIGMKLLPGLTSAATAVGNWFDANEDLIVQIVTGLVGAIASLAKFLVGILGPAFEFIARKIGAVVGYVNNFKEAWSQTYNTMAPEVQKLGGFVDTLGDRVSNTKDDMHHWLETVEGAEEKTNPFVGTLGVLRDKFDLVGKVLGPVVDWLQQYNIIGLILAGTITAILGGAVIALIGWLLPFIGIAAAVVGLTAAIVVAWDKWGQSILDSEIASWIGAIISNLDKLDGFVGDDTPLGHFADIVMGVVGAFEQLGSWLGSVWPSVSKAAADLFTWLSEEVIAPAGDAIKWFSDNILPALSSAFGAVVSWVSDNWPTISSIVGQVIGAVGTVFVVLRNIIAAVVPVIWAIVEPIGTVLFTALGLAASALLSVIDFVFKAIGVIWQGLAGTAETLFGEDGIIPAAFDWLGDRISDVAGIIGPIIAGIIGAVRTAIDVISTLLGKNDELRDQEESRKRGEQGGSGSFGPPTPRKPTISLPSLIKKFTGGAFADGVMGFSGGLAMVGERGPELLELPAGSNVYPNGKGPERGLSIGELRVSIHGVGNDVSPARARRFGRDVVDAVTAELRDQAAQIVRVRAVET